MNLKFYRCDTCKKIITVISGEGVPTYCCGQPMKELVPNMTDGSAEKHVPVYTIEDNKITVHVGSVLHPMTQEHYITWIGISTTFGFQFKELNPEDIPRVCFSLCREEHVRAVYAFCNLHGLWCSENKA